MKLSFSTLGCPDWSFNEVISFAADSSFDGVEIRGIADQIYAPYIRDFSDENIPKTKKQLAKLGIEFPILTSGAYLIGNAKKENAFFEVKDYVILASKLGIKYVRVLGEAGTAPEAKDIDYNNLVEDYASLCDFAKQYGVELLIETNGFLASSKEMARLMTDIKCENAGVIWDLHHTYRYFGEEPEETVKNIGQYIKHTHIKDSVRGRNGIITYMLSGYGDIPAQEAYEALRALGYEGYFSYEWVKRWSRELAEPGVAFYQYASYMRSFE